MNLLSLLSGKKKKLALTHAGADVDSLASAAALHYSFPNVSIGIPDHMNLNAKKLAESLAVPYSINPDFSAYDALILLDFNSLPQAGSLGPAIRAFSGPVALIDHHMKGIDKPASPGLSFTDSKAVSTTELVYRLVRSSKKKLSPKAAQLIAAGIVTDSAGFLIADHNTFRIMGEVMQAGKFSCAHLLALLRTEPDDYEKIAKLKAAKRLQLWKAGPFLVACTQVGCFESSSASALVKLGADVVFAGDAQKGKTLVSARASDAFLSVTGFNLARDVMENLSDSFNGAGGGHAGAAGFNGRAKRIEPQLQKCVELTTAFIQKKAPGAEIKKFE
ncbi:MAG: DHH family phosphoesterase [Candidatus Diapherotrites archaeon]|nr:DHH family phosphoesterase [Candidatus Diapherotrites archaeon]